MTPYPYQKYGAQFLAFRKTACLFDDMGVGKTAQAILASLLVKSRRTLIVCPNSLKFNWEREIRMWCPKAPVTLLDGSTPEKLKQLEGYTEGFLITNYHCFLTRSNPKLDNPKYKGPKRILRPVGEAIAEKGFQVLVADEAHFIGNRKSQMALGLKMTAHGLRDGRKVLYPEIPHRFALTGTPIQNRVTELWSLLNFVRPDTYSGFWKWAQKHAGAAKNEFSGVWEVQDFSPDPAKLDRELAPFTLRRLRGDVKDDLPSVQFQDLWLQMSPGQRAIYDQMELEMVADLTSGERIVAPIAIAQIMRLKQLTISERLLDWNSTLRPGLEVTEDGERLDEIKLSTLANIAQGTGEKIVVFSQFSKALELAQQTLARHKVTSVVYSGDYSPRHRENLMKQWQAPNGPQVFLATDKAGGVGLNLVQACICVFTDENWNPAIIKQGWSRLHREGQTKPVLVITLRCLNTIEEWIEKKLDDKTEWAEQVYRLCRERSIALQ